MSKSIRKPADLVAAGMINSSDEGAIKSVCNTFSIAISEDMAGVIKHNGNDSAVAKQFIPSVKEEHIRPEELADPIGDAAHAPVEGIVHRYPDRCLLKVVNVCPVYCRFCFRREKVGPGNAALTPQALETAFQYIEQHNEIWEVILSGGDPLILKARQLDTILKRLNAIAHVEVIRIHTRVPIVDSQRMTDEMIRLIAENEKPVYLVIHANHADEFHSHAIQVINTMTSHGIPLLSQSVLLAGINDDIDSLSHLMRTFIRHKIKPYYLHHPDRAKGTSHFRVSIRKGQRLLRELQGRFSGICQPRYVLDIPGGHGKVPISSSYISCVSQSSYEVTDYRGESHAYADD